MRRMRELYAARFEALVRSAAAELAGMMQLAPIHAGLQVVGWLAPGIDEEEACSRAAARGVDSLALSRLTTGRPMPPGLVLGVGSADARSIRRGVRALGEVLRELGGNRRPALPSGP